MLARRYEFYVLVARTISHSFSALTREILFLPLEHKVHIFSPPCNILYLLTTCEGHTGSVLPIGLQNIDQSHPGQFQFSSSGVQSVFLHCVHVYVAVKIYFY